ncbi:MAG: helix-turn-helix transcriptional regulator [bacterium]|nr:helix-turn-helix transcriptional regulator [bacterium]
MPPSFDDFQRLLAALQEAALDDARWPAASALIDEVCSIVGNALVVGEGLGDDVHLHFVRYLYRGEPRPDRVREYFDLHHPRDEGLPRLRQQPHGRLVHVPDLYTEAERKTSAAYNEGLRRLRGQSGLNVRFDAPGGLRIVWGAGNPVSGAWQSDRIALIEALLPHLRHLVVMRQALAAADTLGASLTALLDSSRIGVLHLDRAGRLLAANAPALDVLRRADGLSDKGGFLSAWLPEDHERLQDLLARALPTLWGEPPAGGSMILHRLSDPAPLGLHLSPVGDPRADFGARRVAALVLVVDPAFPPRVNPARVARALGLRPSEARVAALLAEGRSITQIAAVTGRSPGYFRKVLKRVYTRLGVPGQVALVPRVLAVDVLPGS